MGPMDHPGLSKDDPLRIYKHTHLSKGPCTSNVFHGLSKDDQVPVYYRQTPLSDVPGLSRDAYRETLTEGSAYILSDWQ